MKAKNYLLLASSITGFAWWVVLLVGFIIELIKPLPVINSPYFSAGLSDYLSSSLQSPSRLLALGFLIIFSALSWTLNLTCWIKDKKSVAIIVLYLISLNFLAILLCVIGFLWEDESTPQAKGKNPLFVIAGIFGIWSLAFWLIPFTPTADDLGHYSLFAGLLFTIYQPDEIFTLKVIALNYSITLFGSFLFTIPLSFFGRLRDNTKKALVAAILYIASLSIPSAILCFIGYALLKRKDAKQGFN